MAVRENFGIVLIPHPQMFPSVLDGWKIVSHVQIARKRVIVPDAGRWGLIQIRVRGLVGSVDGIIMICFPPCQNVSAGWKNKETNHMNEELRAEIYVLWEKLDAQTKRIARLEAIILAMAKGSETSGPDAGMPHTHYCYPVSAVRDLVKEIETQQRHDTEVNHCPKCGGRMPLGDTLCVECEGEIPEDG